MDEFDQLEQHDSAIKCARLIKAYWLRKGYKIDCKLVHTDHIYEISSNIGPNGFPPRV